MAEQLLEQREDPQAYYEGVLERPPFIDPETGLLVVSRHEEVRGVLLDHHNYLNYLTLVPHYPLCKEAEAELAPMFSVPATTAGGDGGLHDRARRAIRATFNTRERGIEDAMGPTVYKWVDKLTGDLDTIAERQDGEVDLIHDFAWELPLRVNMDVLGFALDRFEDIKKWSMGQIALVWGNLPPEQQVEAARGLVSLWHECQGLVAARREMQRAGAALPDDMVGRLLQYPAYALDSGQHNDEVASIVLNMAVAGHETTANAIGDAAYHLLSEPGAWRSLGEADAAYVQRVVEEELRLNPPITGWSRVRKDGQRVLLLIGAANRDGRHFADPHEFQPGRARSSDHMTFGAGIHFCIGAPLARLEMRSALPALARRYPDARLAPGFAERSGKYHRNLGFRALKELPVVVRAGALPQGA